MKDRYIRADMEQILKKDVAERTTVAIVIMLCGRSVANFHFHHTSLFSQQLMPSVASLVFVIFNLTLTGQFVTTKQLRKSQEVGTYRVAVLPPSVNLCTVPSANLNSPSPSISMVSLDQAPSHCSPLAKTQMPFPWRWPSAKPPV